VPKHLSEGASGAAHLAAFARLKLDVVDEGAIGDVLELAAVAGFDIGSFAAHDDVADLKPIGFNDVTLFAIGVGDEAMKAVRFGSYSIALTVPGCRLSDDGSRRYDNDSCFHRRCDGR
jgi:hypothetical protein